MDYAQDKNLQRVEILQKVERFIQNYANQGEKNKDIDQSNKLKSQK